MFSKLKILVGVLLLAAVITIPVTAESATLNITGSYNPQPMLSIQVSNSNVGFGEMIEGENLLDADTLTVISRYTSYDIQVESSTGGYMKTSGGDSLLTPLQQKDADGVFQNVVDWGFGGGYSNTERTDTADLRFRQTVLPEDAPGDYGTVLTFIATAYTV